MIMCVIVVYSFIVFSGAECQDNDTNNTSVTTVSTNGTNVTRGNDSNRMLTGIIAGYALAAMFGALLFLIALFLTIYIVNQWCPKFSKRVSKAIK